MGSDLIIIYPFRNRDMERVKKSLDSLASQTNKSFKVYFVDYGSEAAVAAEVKALVSDYAFVAYEYRYTEHQPWNKSKALNSIIRNLEDGFCFIADIDMIFAPDFIEKAIPLQRTNTAVYFQVGFLNKDETRKNRSFHDYKIDFLSTEGATGLTMFPVAALKEIRGFDEFYHFWGAEDTDVHVRLKNNGADIKYYVEELFMIHQWHPSYRSKEKIDLTTSLQVKGIVQLNHQHLKYAKKNKVTSANPNSWGEIMSKESFEILNAELRKITIHNTKKEVEHFVLVELAKIKEPVCYEIREDAYKNTFKYKLKKFLGKKVPDYLTMKESNDIILLHLTAHYNHLPYTYKISDDLKKISLRIMNDK